MIKIKLTLFDFFKNDDFWLLTILAIKIYLFKFNFKIEKGGFGLFFYWDNYHIGVSNKGFEMGENKKVDPPKRVTDIHNILNFIYDNDLKPGIDIWFHNAENCLSREKAIDLGGELKEKINGEIDKIDNNSVKVIKKYKDTYIKSFLFFQG